MFGHSYASLPRFHSFTLRRKKLISQNPKVSVQMRFVELIWEPSKPTKTHRGKCARDMNCPNHALGCNMVVVAPLLLHRTKTHAVRCTHAWPKKPTRPNVQLHIESVENANHIYIYRVLYLVILIFKAPLHSSNVLPRPDKHLGVS